MQEKIKGLVIKMKPNKWWQWLLMYPALVSMFGSAVPTWIDAAKSVQYGVDFADVSHAEEQAAIWSRNVACLEGNHKFQTQVNQAAVEVGSKICDSGDVLLRWVYPSKSPVYKWVSIDSVSAETVGGLPLDFLFADAVAGGDRFICSKPAGNNEIISIVETVSGCYKERINIFTGNIISRVAVPCSSSC